MILSLSLSLNPSPAATENPRHRANDDAGSSCEVGHRGVEPLTSRLSVAAKSTRIVLSSTNQSARHEHPAQLLAPTRAKCALDTCRMLALLDTTADTTLQKATAWMTTAFRAMSGARHPSAQSRPHVKPAPSPPSKRVTTLGPSLLEWTATADSVLRKIGRLCEAVTGTRQ